MASDKPVGKDKLGRVRTNRQTLANRLNMFRGRIVAAKNAVSQIGWSIRTDMTDIRLMDVRNDFAQDFDIIQTVLERIDKRLVEHYKNWHQIGLSEEEKKQLEMFK